MVQKGIDTIFFINCRLRNHISKWRTHKKRSLNWYVLYTLCPATNRNIGFDGMMRFLFLFTSCKGVFGPHYIYQIWNNRRKLCPFLCWSSGWDNLGVTIIKQGCNTCKYLIPSNFKFHSSLYVVYSFSVLKLLKLASYWTHAMYFKPLANTQIKTF